MKILPHKAIDISISNYDGIKKNVNIINLIKYSVASNQDNFDLIFSVSFDSTDFLRFFYF